MLTSLAFFLPLILFLSLPSLPYAQLTGCTTTFTPNGNACNAPDPSDSGCWDNGLPSTSSTACFPCYDQGGSLGESEGIPLNFALDVQNLKLGGDDCAPGESAKFENTDDITVSGDIELSGTSAIITNGPDLLLGGTLTTTQGGFIDDDGGGPLLRGTGVLPAQLNLNGDEFETNLYWGVINGDQSDRSELENLIISLSIGDMDFASVVPGMLLTDVEVIIGSNGKVDFFLGTGLADGTVRGDYLLTRSTISVDGVLRMSNSPIIAQDLASTITIEPTGRILTRGDALNLNIPVIMTGSSPDLELRAGNHFISDLSCDSSSGVVLFVDDSTLDVDELDMECYVRGSGSLTGESLTFHGTNFHPRDGVIRVGLGQTLVISTNDPLRVMIELVAGEPRRLELGTLDFTDDSTVIDFDVDSPVGVFNGSNAPILLTSWEGSNGGVFDVNVDGVEADGCDPSVVVDESARTVFLYPRCEPGWCITVDDCESGEVCDGVTGSCAADPNGASDDGGGLSPAVIGGVVGVSVLVLLVGGALMRGRGGGSSGRDDGDDYDEGKAMAKVRQLRAVERGSLAPKPVKEQKLIAAGGGAGGNNQRGRSKSKGGKKKKKGGGGGDGDGPGGVATVPISQFRQSERSVMTTNSMMAPDF